MSKFPQCRILDSSRFPNRSESRRVHPYPFYDNFSHYFYFLPFRWLLSLSLRSTVPHRQTCHYCDYYRWAWANAKAFRFCPMQRCSSSWYLTSTRMPLRPACIQADRWASSFVFNAMKLVGDSLYKKATRIVYEVKMCSRIWTYAMSMARKYRVVPRSPFVSQWNVHYSLVILRWINMAWRESSVTQTDDNIECRLNQHRHLQQHHRIK